MSFAESSGSMPHTSSPHSRGGAKGVPGGPLPPKNFAWPPKIFQVSFWKSYTDHWQLPLLQNWPLQWPPQMKMSGSAPAPQDVPSLRFTLTGVPTSATTLPNARRTSNRLRRPSAFFQACFFLVASRDVVAVFLDVLLIQCPFHFSFPCWLSVSFPWTPCSTTPFCFPPLCTCVFLLIV